MKKSVLLLLLLIVASATFCNAQTYRAKIAGGISSVATVTIGPDGPAGAVFVNTNPAPPLPKDDYLIVSPTLTLSVSDSGVLNISGGRAWSKRWWVPFDGGQVPVQMAEGDEVVCNGCPKKKPTKGDCTSSIKNNKAKCGGCSGNCKWKSTIAGSGPTGGSYMLIEAASIIYNGVSY